MQGLGGHSGTQRELTLTMGSEVFSVGERRELRFTIPQAALQGID